MNKLKIAGSAIVLAGLCGLLYPLVGQWINHGRYVHKIEAYEEETDESGAELEAARQYNASLARRSEAISALSEKEREEYEKQLSSRSIMAYIDVLGEKLPIYHGTSEEVLQHGIGHLEGSSLPVGGESCNTVLTGHSGLASRKLFTDLDKLKIGDRFTVRTLGETLTYEVDDYYVSLPEEVELSIPEGEDLCTLITCTPIGANTHRLVVQAHRVSNDPGQANETDGRKAAWILAGFVLLGLCGSISYIIWRRRS